MYPVTDEFKVSVRQSHRLIVKAEVLRDGQVLATIYPDAGSVEIDQRRAQRRTCALTLHAGGQSLVVVNTYSTYATLSAGSATYAALGSNYPNYGATREIVNSTTEIVDDGLVPSTGLDLLTPYGNELRLWRGIQYRKVNDDGTVETVDEFVPLGVFLMTEVTINTDGTGLVIDIAGTDRALRVARARWTDPYQIASGTNVATAILALLQDRYADIQTRFTSTSATTAAVTLGLDNSNDPWSDAQKLAEAAALSLYFDADGVCVLEPVSDYTVAATVEAYEEGSEAMLLNASRTLSSDGVFNAVLVTAEGTDMPQPYRSLAVDDNPASPTYVYGPFGFVPEFVSSPLVTSQEAADNLARAKLAELRGTNESISWGQIVDPSLDAGDIVAIRNTAAKITRAMVLDRLTIPLSPEEAMNASGRTIVFNYGETIVTGSGAVVVVNEANATVPSSDTASGIVRSQAIP